jgi:hypothetical protein
MKNLQLPTATSYIELDKNIAILLKDPNSKDLEKQRSKLAKGVKTRPPYYHILSPA